MNKRYNLGVRDTKNTIARYKRSAADTAIYVILTVMMVLWVFPFVFLLLQSIRGDITGPSYSIWPKDNNFTFQKYIDLFNPEGIKLSDTTQTFHFVNWYVNTLIVAIIVALIQTIIVLMTAYALSRLRFKGRQALMKFMLILGMFPGFLSMIAIYRILQALELSTSIFGLILVYISGSMTGYYVSKGFFDTISHSLDEAAMIDGANKNTIFWKVILPLSKPIVVNTVLNSFIGPWGDFMMSNYLVGRASDTSWTVAVGLQSWISQTNVPYFFTHFCAAGVVISLPIIIAFFFLQRFYVEGVTGGAVKG